MNSNEKYNSVINIIAQKKEGTTIKADEFKLNSSEFMNIIQEIENDNLFNKGYRLLDGGYVFMGLTFKGQNFIENSDKKEYLKIQRTEITNHVHVGGNNSGNIVLGDGNYIGNSEFETKFSELISLINASQLQDKNIIIKELNSRKNNKESLQQYVGKFLTRGAEVGSMLSAITGLLSLLWIKKENYSIAKWHTF